MRFQWIVLLTTMDIKESVIILLMKYCHMMILVVNAHMVQHSMEQLALMNQDALVKRMELSGFQEKSGQMMTNAKSKVSMSTLYLFQQCNSKSLVLELAS